MKCFPLCLLWGSQHLLIVKHNLSGNCRIDLMAGLAAPHTPHIKSLVSEPQLAALPMLGPSQGSKF